MLNLEAPKRGYTRIIELENDDQRIAELIPDRMPTTVPNSPGYKQASEDGSMARRRSRGRSIGERRGAFGGQVSTMTAFQQRFDMRVSGTVQEGRLVFLGKTQTLTWQRREMDGHAEWVLQPQTSAGRLEQHRQDLANNIADRAHSTQLTPINTSSSSFRPRDRLARIDSATSQFTLVLDDESVLSEAHDSHSARFDPSHRKETVLSSVPVPHLRHFRPHDQMTSMHAIADRDDAVVMLLISALWIIWASNDIMALDEHGVSTEKEGPHPLQGHAVRNGRTTSVSLSDDLPALPREKMKKQKRGFWQVLGRLCSS
jgi:hypothetical protein